ncbi:cytochrome P450 [Methylobacterium soli]|uniref:Cytochrome P450 n=1 Tax=Methylobacterium soli TaxID=553447 RepID=A0A6L3T0K4_9HYPH|nr:cytochrome P450 [Methylobacterium soli]KAB1079499.1 cytochrome P450 [Methylobacterium soli]GJE45929.1 Cytochrome P450 107B1 [Methylobacterium soli]
MPDALAAEPPPLSQDDTLFARILDPANRANPYPLLARLREKPVRRQQDGSYVVSTHAAIRSLLFDPRLSSEDLPPFRRPPTGNPLKDWLLNPIKDRIATAHRPLIFRDPPDHDSLRHLVMEQFTVKRVRGTHDRVAAVVDTLIERCRGRDRVCLVEDLSYPLPVAVICELLGVPEQDESQFQSWATQLSTALEPDARRDADTRRANVASFDAIADYMRALIREKRRKPADDMLSGLANHADPTTRKMSDFDLVSTAILLLVAGHETTVNLITNGMLTLLRHPHELERLRADPERAPRVIEELLRYEPPVHFRTRKALGDIAVAGETIPKGASVMLVLAAASRDPERFPNPDIFDPDRADIQHFGFGAGLHYCVGAPLARIEVEIALVRLCQRLIRPRLAQDPPSYRPGAALRGPAGLEITIDGIV